MSPKRSSLHASLLTVSGHDPQRAASAPRDSTDIETPRDPISLGGHIRGEQRAGGSLFPSRLCQFSYWFFKITGR